MQMQELLNGDELVISVKGDFTFNDSQRFRHVIQSIQGQNAKRVVLDFSETDFVDSAALGMLLLVKDEAGKKKASLHLRTKDGSQPERMFRLSKFDAMFNLEVV